jgi:hypothetical protein
MLRAASFRKSKEIGAVKNLWLKNFLILTVFCPSQGLLMLKFSHFYYHLSLSISRICNDSTLIDVSFSSVRKEVK